MFSRRTFLATAAASLATAKTLQTIGVQLYTVRSVLPEKPVETLKALEQIGYRECEVVGRDLDKIWSSLKQTSLKPVSVHLDTKLFMSNQAELPAALHDAVERGFRYIVCPYIAPQDRGGVEAIKKLAGALNSAGEKCRAAGATLAYHNHAFEFEPAPAGGTLLDVLMQSTDPKLVQLELDVMWVRVAGVEPVQVINQYQGRIPLMHLKNLRSGVEKRFDEKVPRDAFAEVGKGIIDIKEVLSAASRVGVRHYFVEQDQTPGNPLDSLRESFEHLKRLTF